MARITIPKKITKGKELVVIPKKDWERLQKMAKIKISQIKLEKGLRDALREVKAGKMIGPFGKAKDLVKSLESK